MTLLRFGGFTLDVEAGALSGPDGSVSLRPKAQALLAHLIRNAGRALAKDEIFDTVWAGVIVSEDTITQTIHEIRGALGDHAQTVIRTVPRRGYLFALDALETEISEPKGLSIAVLPFVNLSSDPEQQFFADGLTEDVTSALALIRELYVVPKVLSAARPDRNQTPDKLASALGAAYLLTGAVRVALGRLRVTTQLIEGATGRQLWARRFDGAASDIFAFQDQITRDVCAALAVEFTLGWMDLLSEGQTTDLRAWERMIMAHNHYERWTEADNRRARVLLAEALEIDPGYVGAMILLGKTHWAAARFYASTDKEMALAYAEDLARRALAANPNNGSAHMLLGQVAHLRDRHDESLALCRKACELAPGDSSIRCVLGVVSNYAGEIEASLAAFSAARRLSAYPLAWTNYNHALALMWAGNPDRAGDMAVAYREAMPTDPYAYVNLATIRSFAGRIAEARVLVAELRRRTPDFSLADLRRSQHYRDPARLERVLSVLAAAGLPDA